MKKMTSVDYVKERGERCPACRNPQTEGGPVDIVDTRAEQEMSCTECDSTWKDIYKLTGFVELDDQAPQLSEETVKALLNGTCRISIITVKKKLKVLIGTDTLKEEFDLYTDALTHVTKVINEHM